MSIANRRDEIDLIVDDILACPDRADELKCLLRDRLESTGVKPKRNAQYHVVHSSSDAEFLWDNVPV